MKIKIWIILQFFFLLALLFSMFYLSQLALSFNEKPFGIANDLPSPADRINESSIHIYEDKVVIVIPNSFLVRFAATKSMDPVLDVEANAIEIKPEKPSDLQVGDIISYRSVSGDVIIHRIVKIGDDEKGWYAITKGDNNEYADIEKVRFEQIRGVVIALIY
ncbi:MAG: signal peptidase I [Candidatus Pacearchaeota archaeon]